MWSEKTSMSKGTSICREAHSLLNIELSSGVCCCHVVDFDQYFMFYTLKTLCMLSTSLEPCCQAGDKMSINIMNWHFFFPVFQTVEVSTRARGLQRWLITWSRNVCVGSRPCTSRVSRFHSASLCVWELIWSNSFLLVAVRRFEVPCCCLLHSAEELI